MMRIAAVGDLHVGTDSVGTLRPHLAHLRERADLFLLAGDLTRIGRVEEAEVLAGELVGLGVPTMAVLGNHDHHADEVDKVVEVLESAGVTMVDGAAVVLEVNGARVGVAGTKGFGGGFAGACGSDFGEPEMKAFVAHTKALAERLEEAVAGLDADHRVALLHYSPVPGTLQGERLEIYPFLGSYLLAEAIDHAGADLVIHGHAHAGTFEGRVGEVPVYNVSVPVMGRAFWVFELARPLPDDLTRGLVVPQAQVARVP